jgi:hypothetical protein
MRLYAFAVVVLVLCLVALTILPAYLVLEQVRP